MRIVSAAIALLLLSTSGFAQILDRNEHHFGKVKDWNNPVAIFHYTNISDKTQSFLPIAYMEDISVSFEKDKVLPGESVEVYVKFYTESFGRFERSVKFYVSNSYDAMEVKVDGKIVSFHPDAFSYCPRADGRSEEMEVGFRHEIEVRDAETAELIDSYQLKLKSGSSKWRRSIEKKDLNSGKYRLVDMQPNLYDVTISSEGYLSYEALHYINRNSNVSVVYLKKDPSYNRDEVLDQDPIEIVEPEVDEVEEPKEAEVEEEVVVVETETPKIDSSELTESGSLNSALFQFNNIVFVIDVSASMRKEEKLPLLKYSMAKLVEVLRENDRVTIITYSSSVDVVIDNVSGSNKEEIMNAVLALEAKGSSYGSEALDKAYDLAKEHFIEDGNNEVILASDGLFNSSDFKEGKVYRKAWWNFKSNKLRLSTIAFGRSKSALDFMERSARYGGGNYIQIPDKKVASEVLVQNIMEHSKK